MKLISLAFLLTLHLGLQAQAVTIEPNLSEIENSDKWVLHNRELVLEKDEVHLNALPGDGLLWMKDLSFENGTIELDIKGKNERGRSFVGLAFHIANDSTYDAVYFRPFNFKDKDKHTHSVQYISHPENTWHSLRKQYPDKFENTIQPVPEPDDWFHVTIIVNYPEVSVFVDGSETSSLNIEQLSNRQKGYVGLWVGNNSEGSFKNLEITPRP